MSLFCSPVFLSAILILSFALVQAHLRAYACAHTCVPLSLFVPPSCARAFMYTHVHTHARSQVHLPTQILEPHETLLACMCLLRALTGCVCTYKYTHTLLPARICNGTLAHKSPRMHKPKNMHRHVRARAHTEVNRKQSFLQ